ncbi:MAG TPA: hypothetical protein VK533_12290 [Sphingomonas sp.]|uniref:hypothetical protein n=1 Tax=Sphingomonas sp. TaxID=28214 RepID=UPI002B56E709|nr:hypothetical protein [Sphingomonas sp.]HMI20316.1 hypothetical protein [Sphingomonas sp.]
MNSAIVEEGSVASGDGHQGYAARRRNLACRPLALGRPTAHMKACRLNGDYQPAEPPRPKARPHDQLFIAQRTEADTSGDGG